MDCFMQRCRLCTSDKNVSFTIHNPNSTDKSFLDKLEAIVPEIVDCIFKLPNGICTNCTVQLNQAYIFIKQCFESQIILKQRHLNKQHCRLCAGSKNITLTLSSMDSDNVLLSCKLETIASEILECNEKLPDCICLTCSVRLNETYKFVEKCFKSHEIFKRYAKQQLQNSAVTKNNTSSYLNNEENNANFDSLSIKEEINDDEYITEDLATERNIKVEESLENTCIKEETVNEENIVINLETDINIKVEKSVESENNGKFDAEETINEEYFKSILENNTDIKFEENLEVENLDLHSELIIKEENSQNNISSLEESYKSVKKGKSHKGTICDKTFTNKKNLRRRVRHANEGPYQCKKCEKIFTKSKYLKKHISTHSKLKPFKCEMCEKGFTRNELLRRHIRRHSNDKPYKCKICEKSFNESGNLKSHIFTHSNHRPYKCKICEKSFAESRYLESHNLTHSNQRPYKCEVCDKKFTNSTYLKTHMRYHTNERRYKCELCESAFIVRKSLKRHILSRHTKEKPFQCEICKRGFVESRHLKRHIPIHEKKRNYKCEICNKFLIREGDLRLHILNNH